MANIRKLPLTERTGLKEPDEHTLLTCVSTFLEETGLNTASICVGLSGGLDSVVLLHILAQCRQSMPFTLSAVHINHGLSINAPVWEQFVQHYAAQLGVVCQTYSVKLQRPGGESLEAIARKARYTIYQQQACDAIALAHHQDDQAETVLLQLMRGSGVVGLAAMPKKRALSPHLLLVRPILDITRAELLSYAQKHQLAWVEDESNADQRYQRNFLRHEILPQLKGRYPFITKTLARVAYYFAQTSDLLADLANIDCPDIASSRYLSQTVLTNLPLARQRNVLYWYLRAHEIFPDEKWIEEIQQAMLGAARDKMPTFIFQGKTIYLAQGLLAIVPTFTPPSTETIIQWQGEECIAIPAWRGQLHFINISPSARLALLSSPLVLKARQGGEKIKLGPERPYQTLKNTWQVQRIPAWQRQRLPLVWQDNKLLMVPGVGSSCESALSKHGQLLWAPWDFSLT
jgi:tRNA(Ile)-lysidine synthase